MAIGGEEKGPQQSIDESEFGRSPERKYYLEGGYLSCHAPVSSLIDLI